MSADEFADAAIRIMAEQQSLDQCREQLKALQAKVREESAFDIALWIAEFDKARKTREKSIRKLGS